MTVPSPDPKLKYQYICVICGDKGLEYNTGSVQGTIELFEKAGWIYKGEQCKYDYPHKLFFEYPKTDFDIVHVSMYECLGSIL